MTDHSTSNSSKENIDKSQIVYQKPSIKLSEYVGRLEGHVKTRYLEKIAVIGTDPAL